MKYPRLLQTIFIIFFLWAYSDAPVIQPPSTPTNESISYQNTVVSLTFDDGDADNYAVRSILAENGLHATFYVVSGFTGTQGFMTEQQLRVIYKINVSQIVKQWI